MLVIVGPMDDETFRSISNRLAVHRHLVRLKKMIMKKLGNPTIFEHFIGDQAVGPEGFVLHHGGLVVKLVDRQVFSAANFARHQKPAAPAVIVPKEKKVVSCYGRFNPPTRAHGEMFTFAAKVATEKHAELRIGVSKTWDERKNPLSPGEKLTWLHKMFPEISHCFKLSESDDTVYSHVMDLATMGYTDVTMVCGSDRIADYTRILTKYNSEFFHFDGWQVVQFGQPRWCGPGMMSYDKLIDTDFISATEARTTEDFGRFCESMPQTMLISDARELFLRLRRP